MDTAAWIEAFRAAGVAVVTADAREAPARPASTYQLTDEAAISLMERVKSGALSQEEAVILAERGAGGGEE